MSISAQRLRSAVGRSTIGGQPRSALTAGAALAIEVGMPWRDEAMMDGDQPG